MSAERLQAAIDKLERLRTESLGLGPRRGSLAPVAEDLILTLHRTIDPMLAWLKDQHKRMTVEQNREGIPLHYRHVLAVADAILGVDS